MKRNKVIQAKLKIYFQQYFRNFALSNSSYEKTNGINFYLSPF